MYYYDVPKKINNMVIPPEIIAVIIKYVKTRDLGKYLTINNIWRSEIIRELHIRREYFMEKHCIAHNNCVFLDKEEDSLSLTSREVGYDPLVDRKLIIIHNKYLKALKYKQNIFDQQVAAERVLLRNRLVDNYFDKYIMLRNIRYQEYGCDMYDTQYGVEYEIYDRYSFIIEDYPDI